MNRYLKFLILVVILVIPALIFLFLRQAGENKFEIPVYYSEGIPENQRFSCDFPSGAYTISWPDSLNLRSNVLFYFAGPEKQSAETENLFRRIVKANKTEVDVLLFHDQQDSLRIENVKVITLPSDQMRRTVNCLAASDTLNQFILADKSGRIRGYYGLSLEEQDRLLVELKILGEEKE